MPYRRFSRIRRNRRRRSSTPWYKRRYNAMQLAAKAAKGVWYLKGLVNSEMFHYDATLALGSQQSAIYHISPILQGDGPSNRTGNSILAKSFAMNGYMQVHPSVTSNTRVMLALVLDTQQISDSYPTVADIFANPADPHTLLYTAVAGRYKILWRKQYTLGAQTAGGNDAIQLKKYFKMHRHVRFNGTNYSDIQKNGMYLVMITSENTNFPTISFNTRFSYHDN